MARLAGALAHRDAIAEGDRVAYLGPNTPELLDLLFACARLGAILVPLSARLPAPELQARLENVQPTVLFTEAALSETAREAAEGMDVRIVPFGDEPAAGDPAALGDPGPELRCDRSRGLEAPLMILHTSGTTGDPKGAVITHQALVFNAQNVIAVAGIGADDDVLVNAPLFNTGAMNIFTTPALSVGATVTIQRSFDPGAMLEEIERRRVTLAISPPAMTKELVEHRRWEATDLSSLRCVVTGSTIVREDALAPWFERGVPVCQAYGLTETMPVTTFVPRDDAYRLRATAGRPVPHCDVRIAADEGAPLARGEVGEVQVKGPTVIREYWQDPEATSDAFDDGWFRTGDAGCFDGEGVLRIVDRIKEIIIVGSCNVYPGEIETVLADCSAIAEAAVVGRTDDDLGEVPVAFVVLTHPGALSAGDVKALFDGQLAEYKHPKDVIFTDALPRSAIGKVEKGKLRESLSARRDA